MCEHGYYTENRHKSDPTENYFRRITLTRLERSIKEKAQELGELEKGR